MLKCARCRSYDIRVLSWLHLNTNLVTPNSEKEADALAKGEIMCNSCGSTEAPLNVDATVAVRELLEENKRVEERLKAITGTDAPAPAPSEESELGPHSESALVPASRSAQHSPLTTFAVGARIVRAEDARTLLVTAVKADTYKLLDEATDTLYSATMQAIAAEGWAELPRPAYRVYQVLQESGSHRWVVVGIRNHRSYILLPYETPGASLEPRTMPFALVEDLDQYQPVPAEPLAPASEVSEAPEVHPVSEASGG